MNLRVDKDLITSIMNDGEVNCYIKPFCDQIMMYDIYLSQIIRDGFKIITIKTKEDEYIFGTKVPQLTPPCELYTLLSNEVKIYFRDRKIKELGL